MDYAGFHWAELLPIIFSITVNIIILISGIRDYIKSKLCKELAIAMITLGVMAVLPAISAFICGFGAPNTEDDFKCKCFIQHCDKKLLEVRKNWPNLSVIYDGEEVFSEEVRRQSLLYLKSLRENKVKNKVDNSKQKIDGIINEVIEKGMNVTVN